MNMLISVRTPNVLGVDARLDRESRAGNQPAVVVRLVIVEVYPVAVDRFAQAVARPVDELGPVPRLFDDGAARTVDLEAAQLTSGPCGRLHQVYRGVAAIPRRRESPGVFVRHRRAREADPGDVSKHRARMPQLAPEVEQQHLVGTNRPMRLPGRVVVRVSGVLLGRDVGGIARGQPFRVHPRHHGLLHVELGQGDAGRQALAHERKRLILDPIEGVGRGPVRGQGFGGPEGLESLHQVARRHHFDAEVAHRLDRAGVYPGDVGDVVAGRVFHRHFFHALQQSAQAIFEPVAARIRRLLTRQAVQIVALDGVNEAARFTFRRNEVVPPAGGHLPGGRQPREPSGDRVRALEVVQQPAVETLVCKGALHLGDRQRHKDEYNAAAEHVWTARPKARPAGAERGEGAPASDGDGGSGGAKPPGL